MWLRVLGSAAGGGFPQWNCSCPACRAVREGYRPCRSRTQSSIAVSADYQRWFVLNASPDIRTQIESFPALHPHDDRATPLQAVLLTDAELDHTLGLLLLREGRALELHVTPAVLLNKPGTWRRTSVPAWSCCDSSFVTATPSTRPASTASSRPTTSRSSRHHRGTESERPLRASHRHPTPRSPRPHSDRDHDPALRVPAPAPHQPRSPSTAASPPAASNPFTCS
jgi:hypothetical protein